MDDRIRIANARSTQGLLAIQRGDYGAARALFEESLALFEELADESGISRSLNDLGIAAHAQGELEAARALFEESLAISREAGDKLANRVSASLGGLACVAHARGSYGAARALWEESLAIHRERGKKPRIAKALEGLAAVAVAQAQAERAARLSGTAERLRAAMGAPLPPGELAAHDRSVAAVRTALGEAAFSAAWEEGQAMPLADAVAYALADPSLDEAA